jgi:hypothetical protein
MKWNEVDCSFISSNSVFYLLCMKEVPSLIRRKEGKFFNGFVTQQAIQRRVGHISTAYVDNGTSIFDTNFSGRKHYTVALTMV